MAQKSKVISDKENFFSDDTDIFFLSGTMIFRHFKCGVSVQILSGATVGLNNTWQGSN